MLQGSPGGFKDELGPARQKSGTGGSPPFSSLGLRAQRSQPHSQAAAQIPPRPRSHPWSWSQSRSRSRSAPLKAAPQPHPGPGAAAPSPHLHEGSGKEGPQGGLVSFYTAAHDQSQSAAALSALSLLAARRVNHLPRGGKRMTPSEGTNGAGERAAGRASPPRGRRSALPNPPPPASPQP